MAISNYSELKTAVANWLAREDLTSRVPEFITLGEARIYREMKVRQMETALDDDIASGVIPVPDGYREMKFAYVDGSPVTPLQRMSLEELYRQYPTRSSDRKPRFYARNGANIEFGPYPDSGYTIKGVYYKKLDALSDANTTNWLTSDAPDLILFASLAEAKAFIMDDPRIEIWELKYGNAKRMIQEQDDQEDFSGSTISPRAE